MTRSRCCSRTPSATRVYRVFAMTLLGVGALFVAVGTPAEAASATLTVAHQSDDFAGSQISRFEDDGIASFGIEHRKRSRGRPSRAKRPIARPAGPSGLDVSGHQGKVNWTPVAAHGALFSYVKATESVDYTNPSFTQQYDGAHNAGIIPGAYHFARPNTSGGATQADYFLAHGGARRVDHTTLPPAVDLEYNPYGSVCYGLTPSAMVAWVHEFAAEIREQTGRYPVIYTSTSWWTICTGNDASFGDTDPLWIARYGPTVGALPAGWRYQTFWQYGDSGVFPGDQDCFNGSIAQLHALAGG